MTPDVVEVVTPVGTGRLVMSPAADPQAVLLLGHGAGGGLDVFDLAALAEGLPAAGVTVVRFEQPWRTAGRRVAGPPRTLDAAWLAALAVITGGLAVPDGLDLPFVVGGRSAGARVACRCFAAPARGVVALSFPLHPPGRPDRSRAPELGAVPAPVLVVQGERDPFGTPDELRAAASDRSVHESSVHVNKGPKGNGPDNNGPDNSGPERRIVVIPGATHSLGPTRKADDADARARAITAAVADFVLALAAR